MTPELYNAIVEERDELQRTLEQRPFESAQHSDQAWERKCNELQHQLAEARKALEARCFVCKKLNKAKQNAARIAQGKEGGEMSRKRKAWRCFHCDEVFHSRKAAYAHFGPDRDCEKLPPACVDPLRADEKARLAELRDAQDYASKYQEAWQSVDDKIDDLTRELDEFKSLTKCRSVHDLRMTLDSAQGELITARELTKAVREKAPEVYAEAALTKPCP